MTSAISSLVRIWKISHSYPGCSFVWKIRVVYFSVKHLYLLYVIKGLSIVQSLYQFIHFSHFGYFEFVFQSQNKTADKLGKQIYGKSETGVVLRVRSEIEQGNWVRVLESAHTPQTHFLGVPSPGNSYLYKPKRSQDVYKMAFFPMMNSGFECCSQAK